MTPAPTAELDFARHTERFRGELRLYCYRMLGSSHDSDDQVRQLLADVARGKPPEPVKRRAWLYGCATAMCFEELVRRRELRGASTDGVDPSELADEDLAAERERWPAPWVEPCPDSWWQAGESPSEARYDWRQSVGLAFLLALQLLPPPQRAILILHDVAALSLDDTAEAVGLDVEAVEAALAQARSTLDTRLGGAPRSTAGVDGRGMPPAGSAAGFQRGSIDQLLLARYARAWHDGDIEALLALLHDDLHTTRAPSPTPISGREANAAFYRQMFGSERTWLLRRITANGQPAFAFYRATARHQPFTLRAIQLVELRDGKIARIDQFMLPAILSLFGVPAELAADSK